MKSISEILDKYLPPNGTDTERERLRMNLHRELSELQNKKFNELERIVHETLQREIDNECE